MKPTAFMAAVSLAAVTLLAGCIDTKDNGAVDQTLSQTATYEVTSVFGAMNWTYHVEQRGENLEIQVAEDIDDVVIEVNPTTGQIEALHYERRTGDSSGSYWPMKEHQFIPEARWIVDPSGQALLMTPLPLAFTAATMDDDQAKVGRMEVTRTSNDTGWSVTGNAPCLFQCPVVNGAPVRAIHAMLDGVHGDLWPTHVRYEAWSDEGPTGQNTTLERVAVSGETIEVAPTPFDPGEWPDPGPAAVCGMMFCTGTGEVPSRFSADNIQSSMTTSPFFLSWDQEHDAWFVVSGVLGVDGSARFDDQPIGPIYLHALKVVGRDGETALHSIRNSQSDPQQQLGVVTQQESFPIDLAQYPDNPYTGTWYTLSDVFTQAERDGVDIDQVNELWFAATAPLFAPEPDYRIAVNLAIDDGTRRESNGYSMGTGQRVFQDIGPSLRNPPSGDDLTWAMDHPLP